MGCEHQGQRPNTRRNQKAWVIQTFCSLPKGSNSNQKTPPRPQRLCERQTDRLPEGQEEAGNGENGGKSFQEHLSQKSKQTMSGVTTGPPRSTNRGHRCPMQWNVASFFLQYQTRKTPTPAYVGAGTSQNWSGGPSWRDKPLGGDSS